MPRGMRGTGPGARKRLQRDLGYGTESDAYVKLYLNAEEARLIYEGLRKLPAEVGTREGAIVMNILYRITEQVMMGEPSPNKKSKRRKLH